MPFLESDFWSAKEKVEEGNSEKAWIKEEVNKMDSAVIIRKSEYTVESRRRTDENSVLPLIFIVIEYIMLV